MTAAIDDYEIDPAVPLADAAKILGVSPETLRSWRHRGEPEPLRSFVVGRKNIVYRRSVLVAYLAACERRDAEARK